MFLSRFNELWISIANKAIVDVSVSDLFQCDEDEEVEGSRLKTLSLFECNIIWQKKNMDDDVPNA